jgi:hypothetical protein
MEPIKPMKPMAPMKPMEPMKWKETPRWWPEEFGEPNSAGSQNDLQYAYFSDARRLLLRAGGQVTTYDTGDHNIEGNSQASDAAHWIFTSDRGEVTVKDFKRL